MGRPLTRVLIAAVCAGGLAFAAQAATDIPAHDAAAVADPMRPANDTARDAERKPAEMLAFSGVKPGDTVVDLIPGGGYFTRLFSSVVGPTGTVFAFTPEEFAHFGKTPPAPTGARPDPMRPNIVSVVAPVNSFSLPQPVDIVWTSQNYHDLHDSFAKPADLALINAAIFKALKPGGVYIVLDHAAAPGSGLSATETLHRIDPAVVRAEVEAAGFQFVGQTDVLRNPADPRTAKVFDPSIRGKTDQFVFKFRKPG
jgi:predicted methyltransferase